MRHFYIFLFSFKLLNSLPHKVAPTRNGDSGQTFIIFVHFFRKIVFTVNEHKNICIATLKPLFHDESFLEIFHLSNVFSPCKLGIFDKFFKNSQFTWGKNI